MPRKWLVGVAAGVLMAGAHAAAQEKPQESAQHSSGARQNSQISAEPRDTNSRLAENCMSDLRAFGSELDREGYWLTGWGSRWGYGTARRGYGAAGPVDRGDTTGTAPTANPRNVVGGPWGSAPYGVMSPRYQIRTLYMAADVLAHRGDESACQQVLRELKQAHDGYVAGLKQAGVEPGEIVDWRVRSLVAAQPITSFRTVSIADVTGTQVRNMKDEMLGTIDDVVIDPTNGKIVYAIMERGGFLGIGEEYIAIPWDRLKATPRFNLVVLDVPETVISQAPTVDPSRFGGAEAFSETDKDVRLFWQKQDAG